MFEIFIIIKKNRVEIYTTSRLQKIGFFLNSKFKVLDTLISENLIFSKNLPNFLKLSNFFKNSKIFEKFLNFLKICQIF